VNAFFIIMAFRLITVKPIAFDYLIIALASEKAGSCFKEGSAVNQLR